jgi:hypothetical protein
MRRILVTILIVHSMLLIVDGWLFDLWWHLSISNCYYCCYCYCCCYVNSCCTSKISTQLLITMKVDWLHLLSEELDISRYLFLIIVIVTVVILVAIAIVFAEVVAVVALLTLLYSTHCSC